MDLSMYDCVLHVAGIAHLSKNISQREKYYAVNTKLTVDLANKAKQDGVKQYIFLSSIIVYGESSPIGVEKIITKDTEPKPDDFYGDSKLQAEIKLKKIDCEKFKIMIIRSPMVYGEGSKGNYHKLLKLARYTFIFPNITNNRSVISIDNLLRSIHEIIITEKQGLLLPQDDEQFCTSQFIKKHRYSLGKRTYLTKVFNPILKILAYKVGVINKVFGNSTYEK